MRKGATLFKTDNVKSREMPVIVSNGKKLIATIYSEFGAEYKSRQHQTQLNY